MRGLTLGMVIITSLLPYCLWSCAACRHRGIEQSSDSIRIEIIEREVIRRETIEVEIPQIRERIAVKVDSSLLSNQYARSIAIVRPNGVLDHTLETIPQSIAKPVVNRSIARDSVIYREKLSIQTVEVERELTLWQKTQMRGFWILSLLIALVIYLKIT